MSAELPPKIVPFHDREDLGGLREAFSTLGREQPAFASEMPVLVELGEKLAPTVGKPRLSGVDHIRLANTARNFVHDLSTERLGFCYVFEQSRRGGTVFAPALDGRPSVYLDRVYGPTVKNDDRSAMQRLLGHKRDRPGHIDFTDEQRPPVYHLHMELHGTYESEFVMHSAIDSAPVENDGQSFTHQGVPGSVAVFAINAGSRNAWGMPSNTGHGFKTTGDGSRITATIAFGYYDSFLGPNR